MTPRRTQRGKCLAALYGAALVALAHSATAQEASPAAAGAPASTTASAPVEDLPPPSARTNTLVGGAVMTVAWYGAAVGVHFLWPDSPGADELLIPVAGPWMSLAKTGCPKSEPDCSVIPVIIQATLTTLSGVGQVGGLAIIGEGLFVPTRERRTSASTPELRAQITPVVSGRDGFGLGVVGSF